MTSIMLPRGRAAIRYLGALALWCLSMQADAALEPVRLQLKWSNQYQFAGYYLALERGYYRQAGFEVTLVPGGPQIDPVAEVLAGHAEFGVASSELALQFGKGQPVRTLASIFQHSPLTVFARRAAGIASIHDLVGKRIAASPSEAELLAMLQHEKIAPAQVHYNADFNVESLAAGRVDAIAGYITDEWYYLRARQQDYVRLSPRAVGVDFYGDTLFTSQSQIDRDAGRVQRFRAASVRGWHDALLGDLDANVRLVQRYAPAIPAAKLRFEAEQMIALIHPDLVEIGHQNPGRWQSIADSYAGLGLLAAPVDVQPMLYRGPAAPWTPALLAYLTAATALLLLAGWLATRYFHLSRALSLRNHQLQHNERKLADAAALLRELDEIGKDLTTSLDADAISRTMHQRLGALIHIDHFSLALHSAAGQLHTVYCCPAMAAAPPANAVLALREARVVTSDTDDLAGPTAPLCTAMHLPLVASGRTIGVVSVACQSPHRYGKRELELLRSATAFAAIALANASAYAETEMARRQTAQANEALRMTQQHLAQQEQLASLGKLVAAIAHEASSPLGIAISAASQLCDETNALTQRVARNAMTRADLDGFLQLNGELGQLLLTNNQRAGNLISSFKRVAADQTSNVARTIDLSLYVREVMQSLAPLLRPAAIAVDLDGPPGIVMHTNPGLLAQVLTNLVENASLHAFAGTPAPRIEIAVQASDGSAATLHFSDNGRGMSPAEREHAFDPFYTTRPDAGGSGLGLHIVRNLVLGRLGGTIELDSREGAGTRFRIRLPVR